MRERVVRIFDRSQKRRVGSAENTENRSDTLVIAHGAQLRQQGAAIASRPRAIADCGEEPTLAFLLREHDVSIALPKTVAAIAVVTAGENIDFRNIRSCEFVVNFEMIMDYGSGVGCGSCASCGLRISGSGCVWGRRRNIFDVRDGTDEYNVVWL